MFRWLGSSKEPAQVTDSQIIADYGDLIASRPPLPTRIEDTSALPHPKEAILGAILRSMKLPHSKEVKAALYNVAINLAQYQDGVGNTPLDLLGLDMRTWVQTKDPDEIRKQVKTFMAAQENSAVNYERFSKIAAAELALIVAKLNAVT